MIQYEAYYYYYYDTTPTSTSTRVELRLYYRYDTTVLYLVPVSWQRCSFFFRSESKELVELLHSTSVDRQEAVLHQPD